MPHPLAIINVSRSFSQLSSLRTCSLHHYCDPLPPPSSRTQTIASSCTANWPLGHTFATRVRNNKSKPREWTVSVEHSMSMRQNWSSRVLRIFTFNYTHIRRYLHCQWSHEPMRSSRVTRAITRAMETVGGWVKNFSSISVNKLTVTGSLSTRLVVVRAT